MDKRKELVNEIAKNMRMSKILVEKSLQKLIDLKLIDESGKPKQ